jgi:hypothetical protein
MSFSWNLPRWVGDSFKNVKHNLENGYQFGDIVKGWYGWTDDSVSNPIVNDIDLSSAGSFNELLGQVQDTSRQEYLEDREHTEQREDTAYQRSVEDMRQAGLNPYTISASPANSSASSVGQNSIASKLQMMGYILDLKNLDIKNKALANGVLGNIIKAVGVMAS